jgi:hypothetical protein
MAEAVVPAVLQELIREHRLFQRPEWQRLTNLEKELVNTLSRTDLSAGQRARLYASLTHPYKAVREDILINGAQLHVNKDRHTNRAVKKDRHTNFEEQQEVVDDEPELAEDPQEDEENDVEEALPDGEERAVADIVADEETESLEGEQEENEYEAEAVGEDEDVFEDVQDSDEEEEEPLPSEPDISPFHNRHQILARVNSAANIYDKVLRMITADLQDTLTTNERKEQTDKRSLATKDFVNYLQQTDEGLVDGSYNMKNVVLVKRAIKKRNPTYYEHLSNQFPILNEVAETKSADFDPVNYSPTQLREIAAIQKADPSKFVFSTEQLDAQLSTENKRESRRLAEKKRKAEQPDQSSESSSPISRPQTRKKHKKAAVVESPESSPEKRPNSKDVYYKDPSFRGRAPKDN